MRKLKSDSGFMRFITEGKLGRRALALIIIGIILMTLGVLLPKTEPQSGDSLEEELAELCSSVEGVGECRVMISYGEGGEVYAVAVLCEGAESVETERNIKELFSSLFGIGSNRISILKISE